MWRVRLSVDEDDGEEVVVRLSVDDDDNGEVVERLLLGFVLLALVLLFAVRLLLGLVLLLAVWLLLAVVLSLAKDSVVRLLEIA